MSNDTQFHIHHDAPAVVGRRERLGVRLLIVADGAFVAGMIFTYFYLRGLNQGGHWLPENKDHIFSTASGWLATAPLIVAAILHRAAAKSKSAALSGIVFLVLLAGLIIQWKQMTNMPFIVEDEARGTAFDGAYASSWVLIAGANVFHYIIGSFLALGLFLRRRRAHVDPVLEMWRQATAGSWFTWIAVSGILCAITTSIV